MVVILENNIAFLTDSGAAVWFSNPSYNAFSGGASGAATSQQTDPVLNELTTNLKVAPWGEDNRFPQNVASQMDYCGVGKSALDWKGRAIWGGGLIHGTVSHIEDDGTEVFKPAQPGEFPEVAEFMRDNNKLSRFYLEFLQDWNYYGNCFPELVLSKDGKKIKRLIHQESCDCRFQQMDDRGRIRWVL